MGMGRSGTTLLSSILNAHPNVVVPPESFFELYLDRKYRNVTNWNEQTINRFINDLYIDRPFRLIWKVDRNLLYDILCQSPQIKHIREAFDRVKMSYGNSFNTKEIQLIGSKHPIYSITSERIETVNPDAKFIHIIRDPRGTGCGQIKSFKKKDAYAVGYQWTQFNINIAELKLRHPDNYFLIKYENLIKNPEESIKSISQFLEIEYAPQIIENHEDRNIRDQPISYKRYQRSTEQPLNLNKIDEWKRRLTASQIQKIEYATAEEANKYGYQIEKPILPFKEGVNFLLSKFKVTIGIGVYRLFLNAPFFVQRSIVSLKSFFLDRSFR